MNQTANPISTHDDSNVLSWPSRVEIYLDHLEQIAETIDLILDQTRVQTVAVDAGEVAGSTVQLQQALAALEEKIAERETLLRAEDAPAHGLTLSAKLLSTQYIEHARLAKRCQKVAEIIATAHERAISLFVCQFHLADLTRDIVKAMSGSTTPETYQRGEQDAKSSGNGGGLFDEAA